MSGINLRTFVDTARLDPSGDIRFARDSNKQSLVNKGTLGQQIWTLLENIFQRQPDPTRASRQTGAAASFEKALLGFYGQDIATRALAAANFDKQQPLSGSTVLDAVRAAKMEVARNRAELARNLQLFSPGSADFARLAVANRPPVDVGTMTPKARDEFTLRLKENLRAESRLGTVALSDANAETVAQNTLKQVAKLSNAEFLDASIEARHKLAGAFKNVLQALADDRSSTMLTTRMAAVTNAFQEVMIADLHEEYGGGEVAEATEMGMNRAMLAMLADDPETLTRAQANILKDDSSFRAMVQAGNGVVRSYDGAQSHQHQAYQMTSIAWTMVSVIGHGIGSRGSTTDTDFARADSKDGIPPRTLEKAQAAMQDMLDALPVGKDVATKCLKDLDRRFPGTDNTPNPAWRRPEFLGQFTGAVSALAAHSSLDEAIRHFSDALDESALPSALKARLQAALTDVEG